jgi:hypothetical protein
VLWEVYEWSLDQFSSTYTDISYSYFSADCQDHVSQLELSIAYSSLEVIFVRERFFLVDMPDNFYVSRTDLAYNFAALAAA